MVFDPEPEYHSQARFVPS